jgi:hypothetical protein
MRRDKHHSSRPLGPDAPHYPSKQEGELVRRLMAESGNTKEEVLASKANRQLIAEVQKPKKGNPGHRLQLEVRQMKRSIAKKLNLPVYANEVTDEFNKCWEVDNHNFRLRRR